MDSPGPTSKRGNSSKCVRHTLFLFNFLFLLTGIAMLAVGVWSLIDPATFAELVKFRSSLNAAYVCITTSCIIVAVAFLGCCGAVNESRLMLTLYAIFVIIILIMTIVLIILVLQHEDELMKFMDRTFKKAFDQYHENNRSKEDVDATQKLFKCCGMVSYLEWKGDIPLSCCPDKNKCKEVDAYGRGCQQAFRDEFDSYKNVIIGVGMGSILVEVITFFFSMTMAYGAT